jgi:hypothetical protein
MLPRHQLKCFRDFRIQFTLRGRNRCDEGTTAAHHWRRLNKKTTSVQVGDERWLFFAVPAGLACCTARGTPAVS